MQQLADRVIDVAVTSSVYAARAAAIDAVARSKAAAAANPGFFGNPAHQGKLDEVEAIIENFFDGHGGIYRTHRENRGKPFTTVKVQSPRWPSKGKCRNADYLDRLHALGVVVVLSKRSNSYLYHVR